DSGLEALDVLGGRAHDSGEQAPVDPRPQLDRGAVRAHADDVAVLDAADGRVLRGQLDDVIGTLEAKLGDALDRRPGEQRAVARHPRRPAARRLRARRSPGLGRWFCARLDGAERRTLAHFAEGNPAEELRRQLGEDAERLWRDRDAESLRELRDPGELVG